MITNIKRKDLKKLLGDGEFASPVLYDVLELASDKIRAIYGIFGWKHMLDDMWYTNETLSGLVDGCVEDLISNTKSKESNRSSAGIRVDLYEDGEGLMNIEVNFNIVS